MPGTDPVQSEGKLSTNGARRLAWRVVGLVSLAVAVLGILLPLVPTTPFLLLAAFCFGRSSERLQRWLLEHPRLGPPIRDWRQGRAISRQAKTLAALAMITVVAAAYFLGAPDAVLVTQIIALALVGAFIFTRPSPP